MEAKELLTGLLSSAYKMTTEEITELLENTDGTAPLDTVLAKDKERIGAYGKTKFQDGFKKAKGETLSEYEKSIREKHGITDDQLQGEDLLNSIVAAQVAEAVKTTGKAKGDLTEDDIKRTKVYQDFEAAQKKLLTDKETEWSTKYATREAEYGKEKTFDTVRKSALNILDGLKVVLPTDATKAAKQKEWFARDLAGYDYELQGDRIVVMKDGKVVEDGHGNTREFKDIVTEMANTAFDIQANNGGGNSGNNNNGNTGNGGNAGNAVKTEEDLAAKMNDRSISLEDRKKIMADWEAKHGQK